MRSLIARIAFVVVVQASVAGAVPSEGGFPDGKGGPTQGRPRAVPDPPAPREPPAGTTVSGLAAVLALIGNTVLFVNPETGTEMPVHFLKDGTTHALAGQQLEVAYWFIAGERLCVSVDKLAVEPERCVALTLTGDSLILTWDDGRTFPGRLLMGNPRGL